MDYGNNVWVSTRKVRRHYNYFYNVSDPVWVPKTWKMMTYNINWVESTRFPNSTRKNGVVGPKLRWALGVVGVGLGGQKKKKKKNSFFTSRPRNQSRKRLDKGSHGQF